MNLRKVASRLTNSLEIEVYQEDNGEWIVPINEYTEFLKDFVQENAHIESRLEDTSLTPGINEVALYVTEVEPININLLYSAQWDDVTDEMIERQNNNSPVISNFKFKAPSFITDHEDHGIYYEIQWTGEVSKDNKNIIYSGKQKLR